MIKSCLNISFFIYENDFAEKVGNQLTQWELLKKISRQIYFYYAKICHLKFIKISI